MGVLWRFDIPALIAAHGMRHFVETGTGGGHGLAHASRFPFRTLRSCEIDADLAARVSAAAAVDSRMSVMHGDTTGFLRRACAGIPPGEPVLFWLDAHFPKGARTPEEAVPLRREIEAIRSLRPFGRDVIVADDLRIFVDGPFQHGNCPPELRHLIPRVRDASFFESIFGGTHEVTFDYRHEGYAVMTPKSGPPTLLGPESLETLLNLAASAPLGDLVEVGVYKGGVAWHLQKLAMHRGVGLHLFDTFSGIPERGPYDDVHHAGDFGDTSLETVREALGKGPRYYPGVFPDTFPDGLWEPGDVAFVHVDCDQYACCAAAIEHFVQLLAWGGIVLFDDYDATAGVRKAVDEFRDTGCDVRFTAQGKAYYVKEPRVPEAVRPHPSEETV